VSSSELTTGESGTGEYGDMLPLSLPLPAMVVFVFVFVLLYHNADIFFDS
jgi:hypothetical protein